MSATGLRAVQFAQHSLPIRSPRVPACGGVSKSRGNLTRSSHPALARAEANRGSAEVKAGRVGKQGLVVVGQ